MPKDTTIKAVQRDTSKYKSKWNSEKWSSTPQEGRIGKTEKYKKRD